MSATSERLRVRIARKEALTRDIALFELTAIDGGLLPPFTAGSHVDVVTPAGVTRQYSLCNHPDERHRYQIAVLKQADGRGGSRSMHDALREGDLIDISTPRNHFAMAASAQDTLLLAGGIGITPLLSMAEDLSSRRQPFTLHYCTRSAGLTAFKAHIGKSRFSDRVQYHFDDGPAEHKLDIAGVLRSPGIGRHLYVCGPQGFMDTVLATARKSGWPADQVHHEFFGQVFSGSPADHEFEIELARSGRVVKVAADQTVLAALAAVGVDLPSSCEQGVCGTCLTPVLDGQPDHRDLYLTPEEHAGNASFLPCCSRSLTARLVLDL